MAFQDDTNETNPMLKVARPKPRKEEKAQDEGDKAYTVQELQYILQCLTSEPLKWQAYINLLADTGIRRGEACGIQWSDINFKAGTITIRRNLQYTASAGVYATSPKNGKARVVDIGLEVVELLRQLQDQQSCSCISKWVFTQDASPAPMHPQTPTRFFKKFGQRYEIEDFHPHKLRHTSASLAINHQRRGHCVRQ